MTKIKYRMLSLFMALTIIIGFLQLGDIRIKALSGSGTSSDPFLITTAADLTTASMSASINNWATVVYYRLENDITVTSMIGDTNSSFTGSFDGNGHVITATINSNDGNVGLFSNIQSNSITDSGTVKNLGINADISGPVTSESYLRMGAITGYNMGLIENCYVVGTVAGSGNGPTNCVGGITGTNNGSISNCYSACTLSMGSIVTTGSHEGGLGGIAGTNDSSVLGSAVISNCYYNNELQQTANNVTQTPVGVGVDTGTTTCTGKSSAAMQTNDFVTEMNAHCGTGTQWMSSETYPIFYNASLTVLNIPTIALASDTTNGGLSYAITDTNSSANVSGYKVQLYNGSSPVGDQISVTSATGNIPLSTNVVSGTSYTAQVKAISSGGSYISSPYSSACTAATASVILAASVTVSSAGAVTSIITGDTLQMSASVLPTSASQTVTWSISSGSAYASINASGLLTSTSAGTVTVKATATDGSGVYGTKNITVSDPTVLTAPTIALAPDTVNGGLSYSITDTNSSGVSSYEIQLYNSVGTATVGAVIPVTSTTGNIPLSIDVVSGTSYTAKVKAIAVSNSLYANSSYSGISTAKAASSILATSITVSSAGNVTSIVNGNTLQMSASVLPTSASQTVTWSISSGSAYASINASGLLTSISVGTVTVKATAADGSGVYDTKDITITAAAVPQITGVSMPTDGTYCNGNLTFIVTFDNAVSVTGTPYLPITIGSTTVHAGYVSGTGTASLTFTYNIVTDDVDSDGIVVGSSLILNGGTINRTTGSTAANLSLSTFGNKILNNVKIDAVVPKISSISLPSNGNYVSGQNISFKVNFNKAVTAVITGGTPYLPIIIGSTTVHAGYVSGSGTSELVFRYTIQSSELDNNGITVGSSLMLNGGTINDALGNAVSLSTGSIDSTLGITVNYFTVPDAPTNVHVDDTGNGYAIISFDAPTNNGGSGIIDYTVTSNPGIITKTASSSPITIDGLTNSTAYTFTVTARNSEGSSAASSATSSYAVGRTGKSISSTTIGTISGKSIVSVPSGTKVSDLMAAIMISDGASAEMLTVSSGSIVADQSNTNVTSSMVIEVTAENSTTSEYAIVVDSDPGSTYTVTFNYNYSGKSDTTATPAISTIYSSFPTPTRLGYTFSGWFYNADCLGTAVTSVSDTTTLYAKWVVGVSDEEDNTSGSGDDDDDDDNSLPSTGDDRGWAAIENVIENSNKDDEIDVDMNGETELPKSIISAIMGKNIDVIIDMEEYTWTINGKDVTSAKKDIDLRVKLDVDNLIDSLLIKNLADGRIAKQMKLEYDGKLGFTGTLTINLGSHNAGLYANLYYYNPESNLLEYQTNGVIGHNGKVDLDFSHASEYVIILDNTKMTDTLSAGAGIEDNTKPITENGLPYAAVAIILTVGIVVFKHRKVKK